MLAILVSISISSAQPLPGYPQFVFCSATAECAESQNGKIRIMIDESKIPSLWSMPFSYRYLNEDNGDSGGGLCEVVNTEILNLVKGHYKVFVDLDESCMVTSDVTINEIPNNLDLIIQKSDGLLCNGTTLTADIQGGLPQYNFTWSSGSFQQSVGNLNTGNYCVTVTDAKGCKISDCENVEDFSVQVFVSDFQNVSECLNANYNSKDGFIKTEVVGNKNTSYNYAWTGPNGFNAQTKDLNNLKPGSYNLTVTNSAGCSVKIQKNLCCCDLDPEKLNSDPFACFAKYVTPEINLDAKIIHPTKSYNYDGQINLSITGNSAKGSLSYNWSGPGGFKSNIKNLSNLEVGVYCVTVTDGCIKAIKCFELYSCKIEFKVNNACKYYDDGEIIVKLYNPNLYLYQIENNGMPLPTSTPVKYFEYHISDLLSGSENDVVVTLDECIASQHFTIKEQELYQKLVSKPGIDLLCHYDSYCNDNLVQAESKIHSPIFDYQEASLNTGVGIYILGGGCDVNGYCGIGPDRTKLVTIHYDAKNIKVAQYKQLLYAGINSGLFGDYLFNLLSFISDKDDCGTIRYCPGNLDVISKYGSIAGDCGGLKQTASNPDCFELDCCWIDGDNYNFCSCDDLPEYLKYYCNGSGNPNGGTTESCNPKHERVYDLIYNYENLLMMNNFPGSELDIFLQKVMNDTELSKKAICGFVSFCGTNFDRVFDNLFQVNCEPVKVFVGYVIVTYSYELGGVTFYLDDYVPTWYTQETCVLEGDEYGRLIAVCNNHGQLVRSLIKKKVNNFISEPTSSLTTVNYIPASLNFSKFQNFTNTFNQDYIEPKGLFGKSNKTQFIESTPDYQYIRDPEVSSLKTYLDDWGKDFRVLVDEIEPNAKLRLSFQQKGTNRIFDISNDFISIENVYEKDLKVYVIGRTFGLMNIAGQTMVQFDTMQYFIASFDTSGVYLSMDKIKFSGQLSSNISNNGLSFVGLPKSLNGNVQLNSQNIGVTNKLVTIQKNTINQNFNVIQGLTYSGQIRLIKSVLSKNDSTTVLLLKGNGTIQDGQLFNINISDNEVVVVLLDFDKKVKGHFMLTYPIVDSLLPTVCINNNEEIFVGITFVDSLKIHNNEFIKSKGKQDIVLIKVNKFGVIEDFKQYGGEQDESVIELLADNKNVFIGGDFKGPFTEVTVGKIKFKTNSIIFRTGYSSYLPVSEFINTTNEIRNAANENQIKKTDDNPFSIYPNPANNEIFVKFELNHSPFQIKMYDINGVNQITSDVNSNNHNGFIKIDLLNLPSGYYIITIQDNNNKMMYRQSVIKI